MGGTPGFISIMHTWGSNLSFHPHLHVLSTCGGLDKNRNWHQKNDGFFLPGKAMAMLFKGKYLSGLKKLHDSGKLCFEGDAKKYHNQYEYHELLNICYENTGLQISGNLLQAQRRLCIIWDVTHIG